MWQVALSRFVAMLTLGGHPKELVNRVAVGLVAGLCVAVGAAACYDAGRVEASTRWTSALAPGLEKAQTAGPMGAHPFDLQLSSFDPGALCGSK